MLTETLFDRLRCISPTRELFVHQGRSWKTSELIAEVALRRHQFGLDINSRVYLQATNAFDTVLNLIALDGKIAKLLLVPAMIVTEDLENLKQESLCTQSPKRQTSRTTLTPRGVETDNADRVQTEWFLCTSGTTKKPKIISHTLQTLTHSLKHDTEKGRLFHWGLLYDVARFAGLQVTLQAIYGGAKLSLPASFDTQSAITTFVDDGVNCLSCTPTMWRKLLIEGHVQQLQLKQITLGGEIADQKTIDALADVFPDARIVHIYASTEAGFGFAVSDGKAGFPIEWLRTGVGKSQLKMDSDGRLWIKSPISNGNSSRSVKIDSEGFVDTEDLVRVKDDRVVFLGRATGCINVGGNKVLPELIENTIRLADGVHDVRVYAQQSSIIGQLVYADVISLPGIDRPQVLQKIQQTCLQNLEPWQRPARVRFVDGFSMNSSGKISRNIQ